MFRGFQLAKIQHFSFECKKNAKINWVVDHAPRKKRPPLAFEQQAPYVATTDVTATTDDTDGYSMSRIAQGNHNLLPITCYLNCPQITQIDTD